MHHDCNLTILDHDTVAITDLNRQFYYRKGDIGKAKVIVLKEFLKKHYKIEIRAINDDIFNLKECNYDLMFCCFDNVESRMQLNYLAFINQVTMIDLGIEGIQMHIKKVDFTTDRACLYCIRDLYKTKRAYNYCTLKNNSSYNREGYIYSLSLKFDSIEDVVNAFNEDNEKVTDEFEVRGIKENILPNTCYIASLTASMAVKMLKNHDCDFLYYNGKHEIHFNFSKMKIDPDCVLCSMKKKID